MYAIELEKHAIDRLVFLRCRDRPLGCCAGPQRFSKFTEALDCLKIEVGSAPAPELGAEARKEAPQ